MLKRRCYSSYSDCTAGKIVVKEFPTEKIINGKNYSVKRLRFDKDLKKQKHSPWKDVGFAAHGANGFEMEVRLLGEGAGEIHWCAS